MEGVHFVFCFERISVQPGPVHFNVLGVQGVGCPSSETTAHVPLTLLVVLRPSLTKQWAVFRFCRVSTTDNNAVVTSNSIEVQGVCCHCNLTCNISAGIQLRSDGNKKQKP